MDYFIDDMIHPSRRRSTKSNSTSPAPTEPPLPPPPTLTRTKKHRSVKFPDSSSSAVASTSSNHPESSVAADVPLPETPIPSIEVSQADASASQASQLSPKTLPASATEVASDYFPVAELAPLGNTPETLPVPNPPVRTASAFFTPMSELPPTTPEMPQPKEEPAVEVEASAAHVADYPESEAQAESLSAAANETPGDRVESPPPVLHLDDTPVSVVHSPPAIMIGISGAPASGKTTLAHLLSAILEPVTGSFIIHQDDFVVRKHLLVPGPVGRLDVDYRRTVDFSAFKKLIDHSKQAGRLPPGFRSLQAKGERERALSHISLEVVEHVRAELAGVPSLRDGQPVGIVDGSLLYHSETLRGLLDIKILLRASKENSRRRQVEKAEDIHRDARKDAHPWETVDYFDVVLWPNYANEHSVLFEDRVVEGRPVSDVCEGVGISVQPTLDMSIQDAVLWVVDVLQKGCHEAAAHREHELASAIDRNIELEFCDCRKGILGRIRQTIFDFI
ncbi:MAG: hypothetical protein LQ346_008398 [Caloplaca aetnensis]|nr:MAG: hypothetical protein LQ346_008398 [Caloplaca aetnensis]